MTRKSVFASPSDKSVPSNSCPGCGCRTVVFSRVNTLRSRGARVKYRPMNTSSAVRSVINTRQPARLSFTCSAAFQRRNVFSSSKDAVMSTPFHRPKAM